MRERARPLGTLAVSEVVGTVLLLGITIVLFSVLSVAVFGQLSGTEPARNIDFRINDLNGRTTMIAVWGQSLDLVETELIYEVDYVRRSTRLTEEPLASNLTQRPMGSPETWDLGESLRLACLTGETCAYPGQRVTNITVIQSDANTVLFSSEPGVARGAIVNPVPDLQIMINSIIDDPPRPAGAGELPLYDGGTFVISTTITNVGLLSTPTGSDLRVQYYLDGSAMPFHTFTRTTFLAPAESFSPTPHTPLALSAGTHTVRVRVEGIPSFLEARLDNNERIQSFSVVPGVFDPGGPYEDGNDDVLYNPYVAGDLLIPVAQVLDGVYSAGATKGLVIPPLTGAIAISTGPSMNYAADRKLTVAVNLQTTGGRSITLTAGGRLDISAVSLDTNNQDITVTTSGGPLLANGTSFYMLGVGSEPDHVTVRALGGDVQLQGAKFSSQGDVDVITAAYLFVQGAEFNVEDVLVFDVTSTANKVFVDGVIVRDDANPACANVNPNGDEAAMIVGTPARGSVRTSCP